VVIAAGNWRHEGAEETMSAWAETPWVVSVGATDSPQGGQLLPTSSVGDADDPSSGPSVVAYGASELNESRRGTSFAAPRVLRALVQLGAWCLTLRHAVAIELGGVLEGIPVVQFGMVDKNIDPRYAQRPHPMPALPFGGVDRVALSRVLALLDENGLRPELWPTPKRMTRLLIASAKPLELPRHQTGFGFVSDKTTREFIAGFSGAEFVEHFTEATVLQRKVGEELAKIQLSKTDELDRLITLWVDSAIRGIVDVTVDG
jgi:hypothetical protein